MSAANIRGKGIDIERSDADHRRWVDVIIGATVEGSPELAIAICQGQGCGRRFLAQRVWSGANWEAVWPLRTRTVSEDIPDAVRLAFQEALGCLAVEAHGGCLLMCRTAVVRLLRDQQVSTLKELVDAGKISGLLYGQADEVRLWANMVGHEDYEPMKVDEQTCEELVDYVESLLDMVYVQPARLIRHKERRTSK